MNTLAPPSADPAWSVMTLADHLHVPAHRIYLAVCDVIRAERRDDDLRAVFRSDLDQPDRTFPWDAGDPVPDLWLTDRAVQHVLCSFRDGVVIPAP